MDTRIYSYLIITFIIKASAFCTINDKGNCFYTVKCDIPANINKVPDCKDTDPYISLVINESPVHNVTAYFFNTTFDAYVRILSAIGNSWDAVQNNAFSNFKNVLYMDLSENQIKRMDKPFIGMEQLTSLNLSRNNLEFLKAKFIPTKNTLSLLDLSYNLLTYLSGDLFKNMQYLRKLHLQGNKLSMLGGRFTWNLKYLNYLNLCCSNFTTLNINLKYFKFLSELNLSHNHLKRINVSEVVSLETINLSHNDIVEFMFDSIVNLPNLETLDLSYNKLKEIYGSKSILNDVSNERLIDIYLNNNNISYIDQSFTNTFKNIRILDLSYNEVAEFKPKRILSPSYFESEDRYDSK